MIYIKSVIITIAQDEQRKIQMHNESVWLVSSILATTDVAQNAT